MALTAVDRTILGLFDRWEYQTKAASLAVNGGTDVWDRVDAAADETFENVLKGTDATALDAAYLAMNFGDSPYMKAHLNNLKSYLAGQGYASIDAYLTAKLLRLNYRCRALLASNGMTPSLANVAGDADGGALAPGVVCGTLVRGGTLTAGTDISLALASSSPMQARVTVIGSADWTLSVTMKLWDGTTKVIAETVLGTGNSGAVGNIYIIGQQAIGAAGAAAGQKVVPVASTARYKVGQTVLLREFTGSAPDEVWSAMETGIIASVQTDTSITVTTNLLHTYTGSGFVLPCGIGISAASGTGGTASDAVTFGVAPERRLKL